MPLRSSMSLTTCSGPWGVRWCLSVGIVSVGIFSMLGNALSSTSVCLLRDLALRSRVLCCVMLRRDVRGVTLTWPYISDAAGAEADVAVQL
jgi:hypothetical protein